MKEPTCHVFFFFKTKYLSIEVFHVGTKIKKCQVQGLHKIKHSYSFGTVDINS